MQQLVYNKDSNGLWLRILVWSLGHAVRRGIS